MATDDQLTQLNKLVNALGGYEALIAAGPAADRANLVGVVERLRDCVCHSELDLTAAIRGVGRERFLYRGRKYLAASDFLLGRATRYYLHAVASACDKLDDTLRGDIDVNDLVRDWPDVVDGFSPNLPFGREELARLAEAARSEVANRVELATPYPIVCESLADPASEVAGECNLARLSKYTIFADEVLPPGSEVTDFLTFEDGEPPDRFVTKIAGLPYRPASLAWPTGSDGRAYTFLAQFTFCYSTDLVSDLPRDVLLIFARNHESLYETSLHEPDPDFRFEWWPVGLESLVQPGDMPATDWEIAPAYATLERRCAEWALEGSKIGGRPYWIQDDSGDKGEFPCALGEPKLGRGHLTLANAGLINFFFDRGQITWDFQCY